jgi:beta-lactamase superfamily II metal-dependent hydrolase
MADPIRYVASTTIPLYTAKTGGKKRMELLWGDRVRLLTQTGSRVRVMARGLEGYVDRASLMEDSLLELYFIDVGQGDGVLVRTPDDRHVLIDGGFTRTKQPTRKSAADFVDWKFVRDYERDTIRLDAMISSHCDADHYGGLWDLLNDDGDARSELNARKVEVKAFYHAGVGWWTNDTTTRYLGPVDDEDNLTQLLGDRDSLRRGLNQNSNERLQGEWAEFLRRVYQSEAKVARLSDRTPFVPGFGQGKVRMHVLAPVETKPGRLPSLGKESINTNGHSILIRVDYGRVRILLTGDLNAASQRRILDAYSGRRVEFACDVAKACHHGSADVSYEFLSTMSPSATIISSGDNESHAHPRPAIVAASALTGHARVERDRLVTPLVYSTEISRSVRMGKLTAIRAAGVGLTGDRLPATVEGTLHFDEIRVGDLRPRLGSRPLAGAYVVAGVIYGLVNVRTDGERILCATLNEKSSSWDCAEFTSRF